MFSKFTSILQHAVDALAPQLSLQEEFVSHWKAVTNFFIDNKGEKLPVEQTSIPVHLEQMLVILQQEDNRCEGGMYGPCLEYLLQHKLLQTLNSLGRTDYPPGMKQIVLSFFTKLLSRIKQPLLAHVNVYRAVQSQIKTCGEVKAGPSEIEEIQFLCTVCAKIKADPYLVNFFLELPKGQSSSSTLPGVKVPVLDEPTSENKLQQEFPLIKTLLTLSHSEDSRVAVKACEGLILCSSLPDPVAAHCLVNSTSFCDDLTQRLIDTYKKLPKEINPLDLENVQAKWGMDVVTKREDEITFTGKRYLISFLSWLDYCDQLSTIANPIVAEALARIIHQKFLVVYFQPDLLQVSETGCITSMAYMTRCLRTVCSQRLLSELVLFLLGDEKKPEVVGQTSDTLRCRLIERCNSVSEEVCLITLQLFDTLLQKDDGHIYDNLVLRNLENRQYFVVKHKDKQSTEVKTIDNDTDDTNKDVKEDVEEFIPQSDNQSEKSSGNVNIDTFSPPNTPQHVKTEVHKIVNSFLTLLPEELKSSYQTVDGGYDMYLKDAHKQYSSVVEACKSWGYPQDLVVPTDNESQPFYEGTFLQMILDKFSHLLDQSYSINLQLTSVISKLALIPHPCLHEFLLDPFLPLKPGIRNLFSIFQKVSNEIKSQYSSEPDLCRKLVTVRKKLMGNSSNMQRLDDESRLEAIIVFEEFCKELSAIVFVKHHAVVTEENKKL
ncbi:hypothetical protein ACF0H5_008764 [Mactra antiquata]